MMSNQTVEAETLPDLTENNNRGNTVRKVSVRLWILIVVLPFIGAFFTLRAGYSRKARIFAFAWLAIMLAAKGAHNSHPVDTARSDDVAAEQTTAQDPVLSYADHLAQSNKGTCTAFAAFIRNVYPRNDPAAREAVYKTIADAQKICD
jgi:hypothetical protein